MKKEKKKEKHSKFYKEIKKGLEDAKEGRTELLVDENGKWYLDGKQYNNSEEWLKALRKKKREQRKKMTPEQKAKEKAKFEKMRKQEAKREEKWGKQRAKRGFSDADCWGLNYFYLKLFSDSIRYLSENMHTWQSQLGCKYDKQLKKVVKLKKVKKKLKNINRTVMLYPDITFEEHKEVLQYLANGFEQLYVYLNMDDIDAKKQYTHKDYVERSKRIHKLHEEMFNLFRDIFYSLWD